METERLLAESLVAAGLREQELAKLPANEKRKVELARVIWQRTTVSQGWIAERLKIRQAANVSLALHRKKGGEKSLPVALQRFLKMQEYAA